MRVFGAGRPCLQMYLIVLALVAIGLAFVSRAWRYLLFTLLVLAVILFGYDFYRVQKAKCDLPVLEGYEDPGGDAICRVFRHK